MGFMGNLEWGNYFGKKRCKSLFWRLRAKLKKALNHGATHKKQLRFQYDPSSYALNFDDGCFTDNIEDGTKKRTFRNVQVLGFYTDVNNTTTWVCVVWDLF